MQTDPPVLDDKGEFAVEDEAVDLSSYSFEDYLSVAFFWVLSLTVFYQFFTRYVMNDSAAWTEEIARYLLVCVVFLGAVGPVRRNSHIQIDFFYHVLPKPVMRVMSTLVDIVRIAFLSYAAWLTWQLMTRIGRQPMSVVDIPIGVVYAVVMLGFALMAVRAVGIAILHARRGYSILERPE
ncbi:TRAP transporter small permease [Phreatobacter aquaticus]|uniref:TRAP transporter small permease protein n=1 Tax=Phreatobacter aquaticus TaxID=2570229 RepID=A0A4D7QIW0_9HYPH|nr:TRAP transporter small permease [Phreatobacter aquaticus]QCK85364.1 TRAP transporter small permease [Phreatobacter aquaticus]